MQLTSVRFQLRLVTFISVALYRLIMFRINHRHLLRGLRHLLDELLFATPLNTTGWFKK